MVKCTNGRDVIEVTEGAYESIYKGLGFNPIGATPEPKKATPVPVVEEKVAQDPDEAFEDILDKDVADEEAEEEAQEMTDGEELDENAKFMAEIIEKPIASWSKAEVKKFAGLANLDLSGTKNVDEAKQLIKEHIA